MEKDKFLDVPKAIRAPRFLVSRARIVKFVITGGLASFVHIATLVFFTEVLGVWYGVATTVGFGAGFGVSFTLQKYWTFQETSRARLPGQAFAFFALQMTNLVINGGLMYVLVDMVGLYYVLAQVVVLAVLAVFTYLVSRSYIFNRIH